MLHALRKIPEKESSEQRATTTNSQMKESAAARRLIAALKKQGVDTFFGIPGGPVCPIFEAIRLTEGVTLVESRHEAHAAFAAAAYNKATGKIPAVVVTAGPGITNAITGIASASMENVPMVVIAGDVAWATNGGRMAQDSGPEGLDTELMYSTITRAQIRVTHPRSIVSHAMAVLNAAKNHTNPGPALLMVPIDRGMPNIAEVEVIPAAAETKIRAPKEAIVATAEWLATAERPLVVIGGGARNFSKKIEELVKLLQIPFVTTPRAKGTVSELHAFSLRNSGMAASLWARAYTKAGVDVALVLASDLDDTTVGPTPYIGKGGRLIHVDFNAAVFNRNLPTALGVAADVELFLDDLVDYVKTNKIQNVQCQKFLAEVKSAPAFEAANYPDDDQFPIAPHRILADVQAAVPSNARYITDIGEHMLFALHYLVAKGPEDFQIQLNLGSMGSGIAGAIGLAITDRSRPVVCICGDGGMQMSGMELLVALKEKLPIIYVVFNDDRYNMVHHGMKQIFGEAQQWDMPHIDFALWAQSFGVSSAVITKAGEFNSDLIQKLQANGGPVVLDVRIDRDLRIKGGGRVEALQHMSMLMDSVPKGV